MRLTGSRDPLKLNATGCIILPSSLFIALMLATAGTAIWPKMAAPGAAILCGGEVVYESRGASYRPGEYIVTRHLYCQSGDGKDEARDDIMLQAAAVSFLVYSLVTFLLLQFVVRPLVRRRWRRRMEAVGFARPSAFAPPHAPGQPVDLGDILTRVSEAVQRGEADIQVMTATPAEAASGDIAARLARLKALRDQGLITAADYEGKKAEILSGL